MDEKIIAFDSMNEDDMDIEEMSWGQLQEYRSHIVSAIDGLNMDEPSDETSEEYEAWAEEHEELEDILDDIDDRLDELEEEME